MEDKLLVNASIKDLLDAFRPEIEKIVSRAIQANSKEAVFSEQKVVTVNQLVKLKKVGGRKRILNLIADGSIELVPDGRISYPSVLDFVNTKKNEKEQNIKNKH